MELKRILAKDLRSATEQAVALYGPDTLVISHELVGGKTEVIVAVDLETSTEALFADRPQAPTARSTQTSSSAHPDFEAMLHQQSAPESKSAPVNGDREALRAREIVDLVRQEMASLKQELQLSARQTAMVAPMSQNPVARQLDRALEADHAPLGLRMLLSEELAMADSVAEALARLREILLATLNNRAPLQGPLTGFHALMGPSGSGKTTLITRLAQQAGQAFGAERVAVISWADQKPGAWQQLQLACARAGVECFRCQHAELLPELLEEIGSKATVFIDTPGVELPRYRQLLAEYSPESALHLVLPADVATHQAERLLRGHPWQSLMLTKLDEAHHAWGTIQALTHVPSILFGQSSEGPGAHNLREMSISHLVDFAIDRLKATSLGGHEEELSPSPARMGAMPTPADHWAHFRQTA
jgi:flagellar biosynthesis protein FlhF